jgi:hypothetical protein
VKTIFNLILFFLFLSSLLYFFSYPEVDPDLWGHLFFGREIVEKGSFPLQNIYSYTAPDHPWINHEWLAEVILYGIFHFLGSPGLILMKVVVGASIVWILDLIIKKRFTSPLVRALALIWTMAILSPGFNVRPQIFTYLFFTVFLFLFYRHEEGNETALYWIPLLMAFWVNIHGGFVVGLGALVLFSLWTVIRELQNKEMRQILARIFIPLILSVFALALNPYGVELLSFLSRDLLLSRPITEWERIPFIDFSFWEFKLAAILVVLVSVSKGPLLWWDFVLAILAALFAFRYQRHTPLFAVVVAPLLAEGIQMIVGRIKEKRVESILTASVLAVALYQILWIGRVHLEHRFRLIVNPREYPTQAVDFLKRNGIEGNLAIPFDWGEYFIWKLYPEARVSIDGRYTTAYSMEVINDNFEWMRGGERWRRLLEYYQTEIAITKRDHPVTTLLRKDPDWVYIYSDPIALIFVRNIASQQGLLARFREKRLLPPQTPGIYFPG